MYHNDDIWLMNVDMMKYSANVPLDGLNMINRGSKSWFQLDPTNLRSTHMFISVNLNELFFI